MAKNMYQAAIISEFGGTEYKRVNTIEDARIACANLVTWCNTRKLDRWMKVRPIIVRCEIRTNDRKIVEAWDPR